jgi:hypothetical protein
MTSKTLFGRLALAGCLLIAATQISQAQITATLTDIGATAPVPGANGVSQLLDQGAAANAPGMSISYYMDNNPRAGSTFTTGSGNSGGYILDTLAVKTTGNAGTGAGPTTAQAYQLVVYALSGPGNSNATVVATFQCPATFTFTELDWLQWSGLGLPLAANTTYAYTFHRNTTGWENLGWTNGILPAVSQVCAIPAAGGVGAVRYSTVANVSGTFDIGLLLPTALAVAPPSASVANPVVLGTTVILTSGSIADNVGNGTYTYRWQTDGGGNGGTLTNIPGATFATLTNNTTGYNLGNYQYQLVVTDNTAQSVTTPVLVVNVIVREAGSFGTTAASIAPSPGGADAYQLASAGNGNGTGSHNQGNLNYYSDNGNNNGGWMGETFTTGSNPKGYYLTSVAVCLDGTPGPDGPSYGYGGLNTTINGTYNLYIFKISADLATAQTIALITNWNGGFVISNYPVWFQTSFSQIALASNSVYGYGFGRGSVNVGYAQLALSPTANVYGGGIAASFPTAGGAVTYINNGLNGVFDIGLTPLGVPFLLTAATATPNPAYALSPVKLACKPAAPGNFTYQWLTDDGTGATPPNYITIPGATATNLTVIPQNINPGGADYTTNYYFAATDGNSGLSVTSAVVTLTVHAAMAPSFTVTPTPTNLVTFVGDSHTYSVTEIGTLLITNQWQFDNGLGGGYVSLTARTNTTLTLNNLQTTNSGNYQIAATNLLGRTNTDAVTLTVLPAPAAPIASQIYFNKAYTNHPWAYWRLNETNDPTAVGAPAYTAYDYSGHGFFASYGNAVTVSNTGPQSPTWPGFDANELAAGTTVSTPNSYLTVPALNLAGKSNVTFMAWINPSGQTANAGLLFNRGGPDGACGFGFGGTADHLGYTWNNNNANTYNWDSTLVVANGEWNFVAYVITPTNATVYLGNLSGGTTNFLQANNAIAHNAETFAGGTIRLGGDSSGVNRNFYGLISEATLFTNALTTLQVQQYFLAAIGASVLLPTVSSTTVSPVVATSGGVYSGQNVLLSASASGSAPLGLQWQSGPDGSTWANVPGATSSTLLVNPFTVGTIYYQLVATNVGAFRTNTPVAVTFNALPASPAGLWTANFQVTNNILNFAVSASGTGKYVGRGILGNGTYWNALPDVTVTMYTGITVVGNTDLLDDGVTHSGIYCQLNNATGFSYQSASLAHSTDIMNLLGQWVSIYYAPNALQFHGVPNGTYNLVVYGMDTSWNDRGSIFVVHDSLNGDQTKTTINASGTSVLSQGDNLVVFTGVHVSGGTLNVDVGPNPVAHGGGNTEADINAAQLQLVSLDVPAPTVTVNSTFTSTNKSLTLTWPQGILQTATNLLGPWTPIYVPSPITMTTTNAAQFYRVEVQ